MSTFCYTLCVSFFYTSLRIIFVFIDNLEFAIFNAVKAKASFGQSNSNIKEPSFTLETQWSTLPLPLPILTSAGFLETGWYGKILNQSFPFLCNFLFIARDVALICAALMIPGSLAIKPNHKPLCGIFWPRSGEPCSAPLNEAEEVWVTLVSHHLYKWDPRCGSSALWGTTTSSQLLRCLWDVFSKFSPDFWGAKDTSSKSSNFVGVLLSEDDPESLTLWWNTPQCGVLLQSRCKYSDPSVKTSRTTGLFKDQLSWSLCDFKLFIL
mgnify:CR=1 FL=1